MSVNGSIHALRQNVTRWRQELSTGDARGTLLSGIAGKAAGGFENLLRDCLIHFLSLAGLSYQSELAPTFSGKSVQKLTLGEVVQSLDMVGGKLSRLLGRKDLLVRKQHRSHLAAITTLRNLLHHHLEDEFAKDEATLIANTSHLLLLIGEELSDPFFQVAAEEIPRSEIDG
jgi:hypothetical protein